jgi:hypothetical protein
MARTTKEKPLKRAKPVQKEESEEEEEEGYSSPSVLETGDGGNIESGSDEGSEGDESV